MSQSRVKEVSSGERAQRPKILVVANGSRFSQDMIDYAVQLAERLDYDLLAMSVAASWAATGDRVDPLRARETFRKEATEAARFLIEKAGGRGIHCDHVMKFGELGSCVEEINHEVKRIEFVLTDHTMNREEISREVTIPMFSIISDSLNTNNTKGEKNMATELQPTKKKPVGKTIGYGLLTVAMYAAVFANADTVMGFFTRGGMYAALPIATVFLFSFAHGAFASNLWSMLGIEALKKDALRQTERKVVEQRKQARKKPRAYVYINPWHRM